MSFIDSIVDFGKSALGFVNSDSLGGNLARTALLGFASKKIGDMVAKDSDLIPPQRDMGTREQVDPDTTHAIPVVYGSAFVEGVITDAALTNSKQTMWYCLTLSEQTGALLNGDPSVITFEQVYWNNLRVEFAADGYTVSGMVSEDGDVVNNYNGKVRIYPFRGNSNNPVGFATQSTANTQPAWDLFPNWQTIDHNMTNLIFALVRVDYDGANRVTGLGTLRFKLKNTMTDPGDVLYDYMTSTRYGAGIPAEEMNA